MVSLKVVFFREEILLNRGFVQLDLTNWRISLTGGGHGHGGGGGGGGGHGHAAPVKIIKVIDGGSGWSIIHFCNSIVS